jgi:hypothetical protein
MQVVTMYGDESCQNGHKFMVLGTIWDKTNACEQLEEDVRLLRLETGFQKEFHWTDLKGHQLPAYKGLIDIFQEYKREGKLIFRGMVVDQTDATHKIYSDTEELHFYKMFFWLIYKNLQVGYDYHILLDRKSNSVPGRLSDLKNALNNKWFNDHGISRAPVRLVEPRDGSQIGLQLADVFAGAISYVRNGHYEERKIVNPNNPKVQLVDHIQKTLHIDLSSAHASWESPSFNIWRFQRMKIR